MAESGQLQQAESCAQEVTGAVRAVGDVYKRTQIATEAAETLLRAGLHRQAIDMANSIPDAYRRSSTLVDMSGVIAQAGDHRYASVAAQSIANSSKRAQALAEVIRTLSGAGLKQEAEVVADSLTSIDWNVVLPEAAAKAAVCLAAAGQFERAVGVAQSIMGAYPQAEALAEVAEKAAERGETRNATAAAEHAQKITPMIDNPSELMRLLHKVAIALAKARQRERAEAAAAQIPDPYWRAIALADVVETLVTIGDCHQAVAAARNFEAAASQITDLDRQAQALIGVAKTLAGAGVAGPARKLSAAACKIGRWTTIASSVLAVDPEAFVTLARRAASSLAV
jgi:tetratricopeptide (TPR) repeat protein